MNNGWVTSNLAERFTNKNAEFKFQLHPQKFKKPRSFDFAFKDAVEQITQKYDNFYASLSGGLDSDFVFRRFVQLGIEVKPIIVSSSGNGIESAYAFRACRELKIDPIVIECSDDLYYSIFRQELFDKLHGNGVYITPMLLASHYAHERGGTLLIGQHVMDDSAKMTMASMTEWDFYCDTLYPERRSVDPLCYTPAVSYAIVNKFDGTQLDDFKTSLYGLDYRPKIAPRFNFRFLERIDGLLKQRTAPNDTVYLGNREEALAKLWALNDPVS